MIRDEFEKLFPVPEGVEFIKAENTYGAIGLADRFNIKAAAHQRAIWQGFQAGHAAGLEDACAKLAELGQGGLVQTIRAMKEQRRGNDGRLHFDCDFFHGQRLQKCDHAGVWRQAGMHVCGANNH